MRLFSVQVTARRFFGDLWREMDEHKMFNGAAALGYYLTLAIFPALIFLLSLLPFLPIPHLDQAVMDLLAQALPTDAARLLSGTVHEITLHQKGGLLSLGFLGTLWATSSGTYAVMQELDTTYEVKDARPYWKLRLLALGLTLVLGALIILALAMIVVGGDVQDWIGMRMGRTNALLFAFAAIRWTIILAATLLSFALLYYFGPDVEQKFKFITPGSVLGTAIFVAASFGIRAYVTHFAKYEATYGSLGAVIVLMLWLYVLGAVILFGSELNALIEHYSRDGKSKGEKTEPQPAAA